MKQRALDLQTVAGYYRAKFRWLTTCVYCGRPTTEKDHVFPVARAAGLDLRRPNVLKELGPHGLRTVASCSECNNLAGALPFVSIQAKRRFIQDRLRSKYRSELRMPVWTYEELTELGYSLRMSVFRDIRKAESAYARMMYPRMRRLLEFERMLDRSA